MPDREKAMSWLEGLSQEDWRMFHSDSEVQTIAKETLDLLKEQEAKTGKWIEQDGYDGDVYYDCSACGESWVMIDGTPHENGMLYCPHCGAKMEGR